MNHGTINAFGDQTSKLVMISRLFTEVVIGWIQNSNYLDYSSMLFDFFESKSWIFRFVKIHADISTYKYMYSCMHASMYIYIESRGLLFFFFLILQ